MGRTYRSSKVYDEWSNNLYRQIAKAPGTNNKTQNERTKDRRTTRALDSKRPQTDANDVVPAATPPVTKCSHTRSQRICCTVYGPNCANLFPCHLFCSQCADWDFRQKANALGQKLRNSRRNECTAKHTNPAYPTTLKPGVLVEIYDDTLDLDDDLSSDDKEEEIKAEATPAVLVRNENEIPVLLVTENLQQTMVETIVIEDRLGETIFVDDSQDQIEEITTTIARLREELVDTNVELVRVQSMLRQV